jgi:tetratricopeptide (TPR) repeat protein
MEQDNSSLEEKLSTGCVSCGHPVIEQGYPTKLCADCRKKFIHYPIPNWVKIFAALIGVILIFAMFKAPENFSAGIHYQRGKDAIAKSYYTTAEKELNKVIKKIPGFVEAKEYLAIASFHNQDIETFYKMIQDLQGKNIEDEDLYREINGLIEKASNYFPNDSLLVLYNKYHSFDSIPQAVYYGYVSAHPDQLFSETRYASVFFDKKQFNTCDSLLNAILQKDATYAGALYMKTSVKRELDQFDSAHYYCDKILSLNKESSYGMASRARTFLRQKKDAEGLRWALKSNEPDPAEPYSRATLALAYHFNNQAAERDKLIEASKKDSIQLSYMQYVMDIMKGKEKFR